MSDTTPITLGARRYHLTAMVALFALIILCIAWELWLAPLRPGGSALVLKAAPLILPLRGLLRRHLHTLQWSSMLILLYLAEGIVRGVSDPAPSAHLGWVEAVLSLVYFICTIAYLAPFKRAAKRAKRAAAAPPSRPR